MVCGSGTLCARHTSPAGQLLQQPPRQELAGASTERLRAFLEVLGLVVQILQVPRVLPDIDSAGPVLVALAGTVPGHPGRAHPQPRSPHACLPHLDPTPQPLHLNACRAERRTQGGQARNTSRTRAEPRSRRSPQHRHQPRGRLQRVLVGCGGDDQLLGFGAVGQPAPAAAETQGEREPGGWEVQGPIA